MQVFYRISNTTVQFETATKRRCLLNFLENWIPDEVNILMDNVDPETRDFLLNYRDVAGLAVEEIQGGSPAQSFRIAFEKALQLPNEEIVYLVEDDYWHLPFSRRCLVEGMTKAHYVTLFDSPYKYDYPVETKVILTPSTHWRLINLASGTFASTVGQLKEDYDIWKKWCFPTSETTMPQYSGCFSELRNEGESRTLICPIPSLSTICDPDCVAPLIDWQEEMK